MSQEKNPDIEELLNSFIDGELTEREQTEVQRLISDDEQVAQRLRELQKTQMLVGSLPRAEAPGQLLDEIKASLEREKVSDEAVWSAERFEKRVGARHLLARKVLTAAAMIGLVAILGGVIYTIVAPDADYKAGVPTVAFSGRVELKTSELMEVDAFINRAIEDNELSDSVILKRNGNKRVYSITCGREDLNLLLADLANIWERFDSSTLFVEAKPPGKQVVVDGVSAEQIAKLITIPKPDLTTGVEPNEKPTGKQVSQKQVHLSIVVAGSE